MVEHAQVVRLFDTTHPSFGFEAGDVWCLFLSFTFDFSVWELWGALRYGGALVVVPHATTRSPQAFYQLTCEQGVTVLNQTPNAFITSSLAAKRCGRRPCATGMVGVMNPSRSWSTCMESRKLRFTSPTTR